MTHPSRRLIALSGAALVAGLALPTLARADDPTPQERQRVEARLRELGYTSWGEIEREDDGRSFEVDDARMPDGTKWDLKLSATDLSVIERKRD